MKIEQTVNFTLEEDEILALRKASDIMNTVCNEFNDCAYCPFSKLCQETIAYPHESINEFIDKCNHNITKKVAK